MIYILIILSGNGSYTNSSTAEFNSKATCEAAIVTMINADTDAWNQIDFVGVCVPK